MSPDFGLFLGSINILRMQPIISARQMYHVYEEVVLQKKVNFKNFAEAQKTSLESQSARDDLAPLITLIPLL